MHDKTTAPEAPPADGDIIMESIVWTITTVESDARLKKSIKVS